jgi:hypothetical protein
MSWDEDNEDYPKTDRERRLKGRIRRDKLELEMIKLQRDNEALKRNAEARHERLQGEAEQAAQLARDLSEARRDLAVATDRNGALQSLIERLTFVADVLGLDGPGSMYAIDPVRWVDFAQIHGYTVWVDARAVENPS